MAADQVELPEGQDSFKLNEVCKLANVQPYMLRFWGTEFDNLEVSKTSSGQRVYSREQVGLILEIRRLLFEEGLTIAGTRKKIIAMKEAGKSAPEPKKAKAKKPAPKKRKPKPEAAEPEEAAASSEKPVQEEVDKAIQERVQPLLATLKEVRGEVADILNELKAE
jgi:DNA-binding transcriptional MerR regulator